MRCDRAVEVSIDAVPYATATRDLKDSRRRSLALAGGRQVDHIGRLLASTDGREMFRGFTRASLNYSDNGILTSRVFLLLLFSCPYRDSPLISCALAFGPVYVRLPERIADNCPVCSRGQRIPVGRMPLLQAPRSAQPYGSIDDYTTQTSSTAAASSPKFAYSRSLWSYFVGPIRAALARLRAQHCSCPTPPLWISRNKPLRCRQAPRKHF